MTNLPTLLRFPYLRWTNPSQDMIVCNKCQAVVAISFHPLLKAADEKRIAATYKEKLCTAHKVTCPFHSNTFPTSSPNTIIPSYLGSVLPTESVQLFEQSNPKAMLQKQMERLLVAVGEGREPLPMHLPTKQMESFLDNGETVESFEWRLCEALGGGENDWASLLALFCWEPMVTSHQTEQAIMLQCRTCLAQRGLLLQDVQSEDSSADEMRPAKKPRMAGQEQQLNPMLSHRHYCPVICGFPSEGSTKPMWQTIATNLFRSQRARGEETSHVNGEEVMMNIHRLLQAGLR